MSHEHLTMSQVVNKDDMIRLQREEIDRLRAALDNIAIGGVGERNWTLDEVRAYAGESLAGFQ
jgi:hypothetical protein